MHVDAILLRASQMHCRICAIAVTHGHPDHAPAAELLQRRTGAPIHTSLERIHAGDATLEIVPAPGHARDHVVFYEPHERALFTGDVVLGSGYVVVAPPGGDMRAYQQTLQMLLQRFADARTIYPGHGEPVHDPQGKLRDYIDHRKDRERQILDALAGGSRTIVDLVEAIYRDTPQVLWPVAARQVLAYLIALEREGAIRARALERPPNEREAAILNPRWDAIACADDRETVRAELGADLHLDKLYTYALNL